MARPLLIGDTQSNAGQTAAAPVGGTAIATIAAGVLGEGVYEVRTQVLQAGTVDATLLANAELRHGATVVGKVLSAAVQVDCLFAQVRVLAGEALTLNVTATSGAGSVLVGTLQATRIA